MKRNTFIKWMAFVAVLFASTTLKAQTESLVVMKNGQSVFTRSITDIDSIYFAIIPGVKPVTTFPYNDSGIVGQQGFIIPELWSGLDIVYELNLESAGTLTFSTTDANQLHIWIMENVYASCCGFVDRNLETDDLTVTTPITHAGKYYIVVTRHAAVSQEDWETTTYNVHIDFEAGSSGGGGDSEYIEINGVKWATSNLSGIGTFEANAYSVGAMFLRDGATNGLGVPSPIEISSDPCPSGWHTATHSDWDQLFVSGIDDDTHNFEYNGMRYWTPTSTTGNLTADSYKTLPVFAEAMYMAEGPGDRLMNLGLRGTWSQTGWQYWGDNWAGACRCVKD